MRAVRLAACNMQHFPSETRTSVRVVLTTNQKGAIAEAHVIAAAVGLGMGVWRPVVEGCRFDLILEAGAPDPNAVQVGKPRELCRGGTRPDLPPYPEGLRVEDLLLGRDRWHRRMVPRNGRVSLHPDRRHRWPRMHASTSRARPKQRGTASTLGRRLPPWGYSSAGRAVGWQPTGRGFESP